MLSPQKMLVFVCTVLSGCAAGVMGDDIDPSSPAVAEQQSSAAPVIEAGSPFASDVVSGAAQSSVLAPVVVVTVPASSQDAGAAAAPASTSTTPLDAGIPMVALPEASLPSATVDAASARDSATSTTDGAATSSTDAANEASAPPPSAPSCNPAQCDNECFLLQRCCNAQNQCACFSVLRGTCSLPSL